MARVRLAAMGASLGASVLVFAVLPASPAGGGAFPDQNGRIAFERGLNLDTEIFTVNPDGTGEVQLTDDEFTDGGAAWSPDGARIAFHSNRSAGGENADLFVMNGDGTNIVQVTHSGEDLLPAWSPDGTRLAFSRFTGGQYHIFVTNADGSGGEVQLTDGPADLWPTWSPDGSRIAFSSNRDNEGANATDIFVMGADGSDPTNLTNSVDTSEDRPNWSPDGTKITFDSFASDESGNVDVYVMDAGGTNSTQLTSDEALDNSPAWSPDGTRIVFTSNRDGTRALYVLDPNAALPTVLDGLGLLATPITSPEGRGDFLPDWQPLGAPAAAPPPAPSPPATPIPAAPTFTG